MLICKGAEDFIGGFCAETLRRQGAKDFFGGFRAETLRREVEYKGVIS